MTTVPRFQLADELLRRLAASLRSAQLYSAGHPIIGRNMESLSSALQLLHSLQPTVVIGIVGDEAMIDGLAQAVAQNRTALLALTTLKNYDNYTFTHMVNVSILTMGQARGLGIDGPLLREFGLAALMHDIGKVRTPKEILNKPEKLTDTEFEIMKRHVVDGAEILRKTPEVPALAPVVAFEHHLRILIGLDGRRLELPYELNLWEKTEDPERSSIVAPLDPADFTFDPLMLM